MPWQAWITRKRARDQSLLIRLLDTVSGTISVNGLANPGKNGKAISLGHANSTVENTIENPNEVNSGKDNQPSAAGI